MQNANSLEEKTPFKPLISIVIPVYNGADFLAEAIDSALAQTYTNIEVIVVNDGSSDDGQTRQVALGYGGRISYFEKENGGTSSALNVGVSQMKGDYFAWLSHDDYYHPKCIERQITRLSKLVNKNTITLTEVKAVDHDRSLISPHSLYAHHRATYPARNQSRLYPVMYMKIHGCQMLIPKFAFEAVGLFDESVKVAQDFEFFRRLFRHFPNVLVPEVLGASRHSSNRQGMRHADLGSVEYSRFFLETLDRLTDKEMLEMAPSKLELLQDLRDLWNTAGYKQAAKEIESRLFSVLHVNYTDLHGRGFNGFDLHLKLRKNFGVDSRMVVWNKTSKLKSVVGLSKRSGNKLIFAAVRFIEKKFDLKAQTSPFFQGQVMKSPEFVNAHLVHLNIINHPAFNINDLALVSRIKPTIWSIHDPWLLSGHCIHPGSCQNWKTHCSSCPDLLAPFPIKRDNTAVQFARKLEILQGSKITLLAASNWMKERLLQSPISRGLRIETIPFGIDLAKFCPGDTAAARIMLGLDPAGTVLISRAETSFKGLPYLKDVFDQLSTRQDVTWLTVGEKGHFKSKRKGIKVIELGWITQEKMVNVYQACDLLLMPSESESFGLMAAEAMGSGKAVLALDTPNSSLSEVISSPVVGLAVKPEEYTKTALRLINSGGELEERGGLSREYAKQHYDQNIYVEKVLALYGDLIKSFTPDSSANLILSELRNQSIDILDRIPPALEESKRYRGFWLELFDFRRNTLLLFRGGVRETLRSFLQTLRSGF